jgi:hypothetical protein
LNNWRVVGYIFLGIGSVFLIYTLFAFVSIISIMSQNPYLTPASNSIALSAIAPYLILASISYVIGGVSYNMGRKNIATSIAPNKADVTTTSLLDKIERLEGIVDNNFNVITKRLDGIEEKQKMASQNTIIKAKKE